ncbi:hypothetical protein CLF_105199 [Clonorchis sinensis]|uniref:Uncharacterized protein n=1 Tax=Clonorchis sinensis TaxID=79923 RepID=G7YD66_CLOSI|nr:hypothetical protein CLF_105199 [Clonorchis sinensis]
MEDAKNAGNVRKLSHLVRSTDPRKPLVIEIIRDQSGSLICSNAERLDRWAQYFEQQFIRTPATSNPESWPSTERALNITRRTLWLYGSEASVSTLMLLSLMTMMMTAYVPSNATECRPVLVVVLRSVISDLKVPQIHRLQKPILETILRYRQHCNLPVRKFLCTASGSILPTTFNMIGIGRTVCTVHVYRRIGQLMDSGICQFPT